MTTEDGLLHGALSLCAAVFALGIKSQQLKSVTERVSKLENERAEVRTEVRDAAIEIAKMTVQIHGFGDSQEILHREVNRLRDGVHRLNNILLRLYGAPSAELNGEE